MSRWRERLNGLGDNRRGWRLLRRLRLLKKRLVRIEAETASFVSELVLKILRRRGGSVGHRRKHLELKEVGNIHGGVPSIGLRIYKRKLGLSQRLLGLKQGEERDLALTIEELRE